MWNLKCLDCIQDSQSRNFLFPRTTYQQLPARITHEFARLRQMFGPLLRFPSQLRWPVQRSRTMSDSVLIVGRQAFFMKFFKSCKIKITRYASHGQWAKKKYVTSTEFMLMLVVCLSRWFSLSFCSNEPLRTCYSRSGWQKRGGSGGEARGPLDPTLCLG